ncbi:hypothetical protein GQ457_13G019130 [Hibiscus cannabinus]
MESAIGLGLTETPGISSWPSLERQGLPVDSDEQRDTKKVKNRSDDYDLPGSKLSGVVESVPNSGNNGDLSMMDDSRDSGVRNAAAIQPKEGVHESTLGRSYAAATAGTGVSEGTGRLRLSLEDIEVLDDDVIVDVSGPFLVICFSDRVHEEIDKSMERSLIVRLLGKTIGYRMLWNRIHALWSPKGDIHLVDLENDYYLVKFAAEEDYTKVLKEGPWTIFGSYLTMQTWSRGFSTSQVFPSQVIVWVRLPGLPYRYYTKSLFRRIAAVLGRVVKVDYNTNGGDRGKFARLAVMLDLTEPLRSCIGIDGFIQRLEYEGLQNICFGCGTYSHAKEHCGTSQLAEVSHNGNGNRAFPLSNKKVDKVAAEHLFGLWMVVEDRRRRARRTDTSGTHMLSGTSGSRFEMLNNLSADVDDSSIGNSIGGSGKEPSVQAGPQRSVASKNGYQGVPMKTTKHDAADASRMRNGESLQAKIMAMEPGRVSKIILTNGIGSTAQHQAITIVENGDGREEGSGSFSRAGLKGIGKKKVQFKKKPELKFPAGGLTSVCSEMVNIRNDVSRRRFSYGEDTSVKPLDDPGLTGRTLLNDTRVTDMLQSDEDRDPVLIEVKEEKLSVFVTLDFQTWLVSNFQNQQDFAKNPEDWDVALGTYLWNIWRRRNERLFSPDIIPAEDIYFRSSRMIAELGRASSMLRLHQHAAPNLTAAVQRWEAPAAGWIKINTDGSRNTSTGLASCGGVGRDSNSRWCFGFAKGIEAYEAIASSNSRKVGSSILPSIFELLSCSWEVQVSFVRREGNVVADAISRLVLPTSLEYRRWLEVPLAIRELVMADGMHVATSGTQFPILRAYDDPGGH